VRDSKDAIVTGIALLILAVVFLGWGTESESRGTSAEDARVSPVLLPAQFEVGVSLPEPSRISDTERFSSFLVKTPGRAYREARIKDYSHYLLPLKPRAGQPMGRSRIWGDASEAVQAKLVRCVMQYLAERDFSSDEIVYALALCRIESGFNPDAAAGSTSAAGLGQFINRTRKVLAERAGVTASDPFCVELNLACLAESLEEAFRFAERRVGAERNDEFFKLAYAYHHDGPSLQYGGVELAEARVLPWMRIIQESL